MQRCYRGPSQPSPVLSTTQRGGSPARVVFCVMGNTPQSRSFTVSSLGRTQNAFTSVVSPGTEERVGSGARERWAPALPCHSPGEQCNRLCLRAFISSIPTPSGGSRIRCQSPCERPARCPSRGQLMFCAALPAHVPVMEQVAWKGPWVFWFKGGLNSSYLCLNRQAGPWTSFSFEKFIQQNFPDTSSVPGTGRHWGPRQE